MKICTHGLLEGRIPNPDRDFWNSDPKSIFGQILAEKVKVVFCFWKIDTNGISRMLILIEALVFWISNQKNIFGQIWARKVKVVRFAWRLGQMVSPGCWFLFQD